MIGTTNLTRSLMNRRQLHQEKKVEGLEARALFSPPNFLACFAVVADDFWALNSCWQHVVYDLTHIHKYRGAHTHTVHRITHLCLLAAHQLRMSNLQFMRLSSLLWLAAVASDCCLNPGTLSRVHILLCCYI